MEVKPLQWQENWSVDIVSVDTEHRLLIDIFNDLFESLVVNKNPETYQRVFQDFADHLNKHFSHEELIMRNIGYGQYREHKLEHENVLARAEAIAEILRDEVSSEQGELVCQELKGWLVNHIVEFDISIRSHIDHGH